MVEAADHGGTRQLTLRQRLLLRLPEAPTSGYRWRGQEDLTADGALRLVSSDFEPTARGAIGGQGLRCLVFEARSPGRVDLHLRQLRAFGTGPPAGHFTLTVLVKA